MMRRKENLTLTYTPTTLPTPLVEDEMGDIVMVDGTPVGVKFSIEVDGEFEPSEGVDGVQAKAKGRLGTGKTLPAGFPVGTYLPAVLVTAWGESVACLAQAEKLVNESVYGFERRFGQYFEINLRIP